MSEGDVYAAVDQYSRQGRLAYVHLRNVRGKVPFYKETFIDDGDVDVLRVLRILKKNRFEGVIIPDHAPQMSCAAPWHAGMAYALGYLRAALQTIKGE
jgi:mannonate dehydratase